MPAVWRGTASDCRHEADSEFGKRNEDCRSFTIEVDNGCARYQKTRNAVTARAEARRVH
jgi:hypothetical protein